MTTIPVPRQLSTSSQKASCEEEKRHNKKQGRNHRGATNQGEGNTPWHVMELENVFRHHNTQNQNLHKREAKVETQYPEEESVSFSNGWGKMEEKNTRAHDAKQPFHS